MQIILATLQNQLDQTFLTELKNVLETGLVSALLVQRYEQTETDYQRRVQTILPITQTCDVALLLDNTPDLVTKTGADGVHLAADHPRFLEVLNALKPHFIVGAANVGTRHEAMLRGETGADYISFGDFDRAPTSQEIELAQWWTNLFEVPGALIDAVSTTDSLETNICEFLGVGENIWHSKAEPIAALRAISDRHKTFSKVSP